MTAPPQGLDAITITVSPKPIKAHIIPAEGNTLLKPYAKTYDGHDTAIGLDIKLDDNEICDNVSVSGKDDVTVSADNFTYDNANAGEKPITANGVTLSGAQSGNYTVIGPVTTGGKIDPKVVKLEWKGASPRVYDGNPSNVNATATELIPNDDCAVVVGNGDQRNAGGPYIAAATGLRNSNYALPPEDDPSMEQKYTIAPASLYIPELTVKYNGTKVFTVDVDGVNEKVNVELTASSPNVGSYDYTKEGTGAWYTASETSKNYDIAGGATLTIEPADPVPTPPTPINSKYTGEPQELIITFEKKARKSR